MTIDQAKEAALGILLHNARGPFQGLPRTAGWGYPEPYTRDLMISALGFLATGNEELADALKRTLAALAANQSERGLIPSLAHDPGDRGASDDHAVVSLWPGVIQTIGQPAGVSRRRGAEGPEMDAVPGVRMTW